MSICSTHIQEQVNMFLRHSVQKYWCTLRFIESYRMFNVWDNSNPYTNIFKLIVQSLRIKLVKVSLNLHQ